MAAADGSRETLLWPDTNVDNGYPEWAPDGKRLNIVAHVGTGGNADAYDLYLVDPDGGNRQLIPTPALVATHRPFSPDGTRVIAYEPNPSGDVINLITLDGSVPPLRLPGRTVSWQPVDAPLDWAPGASPLPAPASLP